MVIRHSRIRAFAAAVVLILVSTCVESLVAAGQATAAPATCGGQADSKATQATRDLQHLSAISPSA
jgi:hypothetical protein